jgi:hypothetical protein
MKVRDIFTAQQREEFSLALEAEQVAAEERVAIQEEEPLFPSWPCPHCGNPAEIEAVCPSLDGSRMLTLWRCEPCQIWAATPSTLREPPVWVSRAKQ